MTTASVTELIDSIGRVSRLGCTRDEYGVIVDCLARRCPCNFLVFGVGNDTPIWMAANEGGRTAFLENLEPWIATCRQKSPAAEVVKVEYPTRRWQWKKLLGSNRLMMNLRDTIAQQQWDVIFVDSPHGYRFYCPGRMMGIFTASQLARRSETEVDVFVHDCDRRVEQVYASKYLGDENLVQQQSRMRHYRIGSARD